MILKPKELEILLESAGTPGCALPTFRMWSGTVRAEKLARSLRSMGAILERQGRASASCWPHPGNRLGPECAKPKATRRQHAAQSPSRFRHYFCLLRLRDMTYDFVYTLTSGPPPPSLDFTRRCGASVLGSVQYLRINLGLTGS